MYYIVSVIDSKTNNNWLDPEEWDHKKHECMHGHVGTILAGSGWIELTTMTTVWLS